MQELTAAIAQTGYRPIGFEESLFTKWNAKLGDASAALKRNDSAGANLSASVVVSEVHRYASDVSAEMSNRLVIQWLVNGTLSLMIFVLILSIFLTTKLRRQALGEVAAKKEDIDRALENVMNLLNLSTYVTVGSSGLQKVESDRLNILNDRLLEQTIALNKFLEAASVVLNAKGLAWLQHHLLPYGSMYVNRLATGNASITVTREDMKRLLSTNERLNADYQIIGSAEDRQLTIVDLMNQFESDYSEATALYTHLSETEAELKSAIQATESQVDTLAIVASEVNKLAEDEMFTARAVEESILYAIKHPETGHIAEAQKAKRLNDSIGGLVQHIHVAQRMINDGNAALNVAKFALHYVVPAMKSTVNDLGSSESAITTEWVVAATASSSNAFASVIRRAPQESIADSLSEINKQLAQLYMNFNDTKRINARRLTEWPANLTEKLALVATSQGLIFDKLQNLGFFLEKSAEQLYREINKSPKALLEQIEGATLEIAKYLGTGQIELTRETECKIDDWNRSVEDLITQSERRVSLYQGAVSGINTDQEIASHLMKSIGENIESVAQIFSDYSQRKAFASLDGPSVTLLEAYKCSKESITGSCEIASQAAEQMNRGWVLHAGIRQLNNVIQATQAGLSIAISEHDKAVFLAQVKGVRSLTRAELLRLKAKLLEMSRQVQSNPYEVIEALESVYECISAVNTAIANDVRLWKEIASTVANAQAQVFSAESAISNARGMSFSYANVDLSSANSQMFFYGGNLNSVSSALAREEYETALIEAQSAYRCISSVPSLARSSVDIAQSTHNTEVRRIEEAAREAQRRNEESAQALSASVDDNDSSADYASCDD